MCQQIRRPHLLHRLNYPIPNRLYQQSFQPQSTNLRLLKEKAIVLINTIITHICLIHMLLQKIFLADAIMPGSVAAATINPVFFIKFLLLIIILSIFWCFFLNITKKLHRRMQRFTFPVHFIASHSAKLYTHLCKIDKVVLLYLYRAGL